MAYLDLLPWYLSSLLFIFGFVGIAVICLLIFRAMLPVSHFKAYHDVAGVTFSNLGVLYAVLLAFIFVEVQDRHNSLHDTIELEASTLGDLYRDAEVFPPEQREKIRKSLRDYAHHVIDQEWGKMEAQEIEVPNLGFVQKIWNAYYEYSPKDDREKIWYDQSITKLNDFNTIRVRRIISNDIKD